MTDAVGASAVKSTTCTSDVVSLSSDRTTKRSELVLYSPIQNSSLRSSRIFTSSAWLVPST